MRERDCTYSVSLFSEFCIFFGHGIPKSSSNNLYVAVRVVLYNNSLILSGNMYLRLFKINTTYSRAFIRNVFRMNFPI